MSTDPDLRLRWLWLMLGYCLLSFIIYVSIDTLPLQIDMGFDWQDKLLHTLAYFVLMFWFMQIYYQRRAKLVLAVVFATVGVSMEIVQAYTPERLFEYADMVANALGVVIGLLLSATPLRGMLTAFERLLFKAGD